MKTTLVKRLLIGAGLVFFCLFFVWTEFPAAVNFLCTAMSALCALFSAFVVAEMGDERNQTEQNRFNPESKTFKRRERRIKVRVIRTKKRFHLLEDQSRARLRSRQK
ncbi:MAG: hypothetical protein KH225_09555 [Proteobacteria bacterium]|uniref:hypothetical protein n=1 Tax=Parasutterella TaxID=577310 RepID=UPI0025B6EDC0|nr:hypothetical protein [uncultured Parasutterella sp.]MBS6958674.1 hypothetical protein [Pseudomonadota bacterium]